MKKIKTLLCGLAIASIGLLSGCDEHQKTAPAYPHDRNMKTVNNDVSRNGSRYQGGFQKTEWDGHLWVMRVHGNMVDALAHHPDCACNNR